jgi:hypothetical protein
VFTISIRAQAPGEIVGLDLKTNDVEFYSINLVTQSCQSVSSISYYPSHQGNSTYDPVHNRLFAKNSIYMVVVDANTGTLLDTIGGLNNFYGIEYDRFCDCIRGIVYDGINTHYYAYIDLSSKSIQTITVVSPQSIYFGESTYDKNAGRYFRMCGNHIEVIDFFGQVNDVIPMPIQLNGIEYDDVNDRVYGTYFENNKLKIASIDGATHQFQTIDSLVMSSYLLGGESSYDELNTRYFFLSSDKLYAYDVFNNILNTYNLPVPLSFFRRNIEYKAPPPAPNTTGLIDNPKLASSVFLYPNPNKGVFGFRGLEPNTEIRIFDLHGKCIHHSISNSGLSIITLQNQTPGLYFYSLTKNTKEINRGKLIIE